MRRNLIIAAALLAAATPAAAQMMERGYQFPARNQGEMAVVIKQVEEGMFSNDRRAAPAPNRVESNMLICGSGGGDSAAKSNSSCVILNKTTGQIAQEQASAGDQTATANTAAAADGGELSEVLESLQ